MNLNLSPEDVKAVRVALGHDLSALSRMVLYPKRYNAETVANARQVSAQLIRIIGIIESAQEKNVRAVRHG
jgi:hypothetical protein